MNSIIKKNLSLFNFAGAIQAYCSAFKWILIYSYFCKRGASWSLPMAASQFLIRPTLHEALWLMQMSPFSIDFLCGEQSCTSWLCLTKLTVYRRFHYESASLLGQAIPKTIFLVVSTLRLFPQPHCQSHCKYTRRVGWGKLFKASSWNTRETS
jgi:hypothetical protein